MKQTNFASCSPKFLQHVIRDILKCSNTMASSAISTLVAIFYVFSILPVQDIWQPSLDFEALYLLAYRSNRFFRQIFMGL